MHSFNKYLLFTSHIKVLCQTLQRLQRWGRLQQTGKHLGLWSWAVLGFESHLYHLLTGGPGPIIEHLEAQLPCAHNGNNNTLWAIVRIKCIEKAPSHQRQEVLTLLFLLICLFSPVPVPVPLLLLPHTLTEVVEIKISKIQGRL